MTDQPWRPLGFEVGDAADEYDALIDGVPRHLSASLWGWVANHMWRPDPQFPDLRVYDVPTARQMERVLRIPTQYGGHGISEGIQHLRHTLTTDDEVLRVVDYLLSEDASSGEALESILQQAGSAWTVGQRAGRPGLVRRVPEGVQLAAEQVAAHTTGLAGRTLREAWEALYGVTPDPSLAYSKAIKSVEHAAIPVVSPRHTSATLGSVISQMEQQGNWKLPMDREHQGAPTQDVLIANLRVLWNGQHDRHGGQPSAPGAVNTAEAEVAVMLAVSLVQWFSSGLVQRRP